MVEVVPADEIKILTDISKPFFASKLPLPIGNRRSGFACGVSGV